MFQPEKIRNVAIIAHIDHGKTTMMDSLLKQSAIFQDHEKVPERVMDSYDQEKERGITIFSKHTTIFYQDFKINLIDTPGHADFSGEVERVLGMVNCVLLLIDAQEGPMPQTRYVLRKSLAMGLKPIVILNKIDRPNANPDHALNLTFDLFSELGASDDQLDFHYCYASGIGGFAMRQLSDPRESMKPLFEAIIEWVPHPQGDLAAPFLMQVATIGYDDYLGRKACGRILAGKVKKGTTLFRSRSEEGPVTFKVQRVEGHHGLKTVEMAEAGVGDIVAICGIDDVTIGDVIEGQGNPIKLKPITVDEPTVSIDIMVNSSPTSGQDGKNLTMSKVKERLMKEKKTNVTLGIEFPEGKLDKVTVSGRGELHLAVLIEAMRRDQFELIVSNPQVIIKTIDGQKCEPLELAHIEVPKEFSGSVIEELSRRKGEMQSLDTDEHNITRMNFLIPMRGLMGYRSELLTKTRGLGIMTSNYHSYAPWKGEIPSRTRGVLISLCAGESSGYSLFGLQERGELFIGPGTPVYEGMVVGEHSRPSDLIVNVTKGKQLTNMRASGKDEAISLTPPRHLTLEQAIDFIQDDEYVEVTPKNIRIRKRYLTENERKRAR